MTFNGPFQPYPFFPFIQHWEDHTWRPGSNSVLPLQRDIDTLEKPLRRLGDRSISLLENPATVHPVEKKAHIYISVYKYLM